MSTTETQQRKKGVKTYAQLLEEIKELMSRTAANYVPKLADALKEENPELSNKEIHEQLVRDCYQFDWAASTVYQYMPSWLHDQKQVARMKKAWESRHALQLRDQTKDFNLLFRTDQIKPLRALEPKAEEYNQDEDDDDDGSDIEDAVPMLREYGDNDKSILSLYAEINIPTRLLFKALTRKEMPSPMEDLVIDYLKPSREYRKGIFYEVEENMRASLYNNLAYLRDAITDTLELLDAIEKKASK